MKNCAKTGNKSVGESAKAGRWLGGSIGLAIMVGVVFWVVTEAYPEIAAALAATDPVAASGGAPVQSATKEERVKIALLGPDQWSSEVFDLAKVPKGVQGFFDCPPEGRVLFSNGESGLCNKEGGYGVRRGIVRFKGKAGDHVTVCWGGKCDPEVRTGDDPQGWNAALEEFQRREKEKEEEGN